MKKKFGTCSVEGCGRKEHRRGLCDKHHALAAHKGHLCEYPGCGKPATHYHPQSTNAHVCGKHYRSEYLRLNPDIAEEQKRKRNSPEAVERRKQYDAARRSDPDLREQERESNREYARRTLATPEGRTAALNARARHLGVAGTLSVDHVAKLMAEDTCPICGEFLDLPDKQDCFGYVVPFTKGGLNEDANLQRLHRSCQNKRVRKSEGT
jgi:hypothetical protein